MTNTCPIFLLLLGLIFSTNVDGHADGQHVDGACLNLVPGHGSNSLSTPPPYKITLNATSYTPGTPVSITLLACNGAFKGYMIQARLADISKNQSELYGTFTANESHPACIGGNGSALVHSNGSPKTTVNIQWTPPQLSVGHIIFRVTYVLEVSTFWANIRSDVLYDASLNSASGALENKTDVDPVCSGGQQITSITTTAATSDTSKTNLTKDASCGQTKGCFSSCSGRGCTFTVSWVTSANISIFVLSTEILNQGNTYIALGFSSDSEMGDDSVMACAMNSSGNVFLVLGVNRDNNGPEIFIDSEVQLLNSSTVNGVLFCTISRPVSEKSNRYDITKPWTLLLAQGNTVTDTNTGVPFLTSHKERKFISEEQVTANSIVDLGSDTSGNPMIKAHGCLMVGAWIFLASVGIVVARYYKPVWEVTMCSQKVWFQIHRLCMVLVFCATAAGFIIIFVEEKEWSEIDVEGKQFLVGHPIIGVIVMALTVINPIMALFRPHPGTTNRPIFNWAHWFVGTAAHILAVIGVFFGVQIPDSQVPYYTVYILAAFVAWQLFVEILLELITCIGRKRVGGVQKGVFSNIDRSESYELNGGGDPPKAIAYTESNKVAIVKLVILVLHIIIVGALSAAVIAIIAIGEKELED
ncbi:ferric-chelate reductase 1 [Biomphalaria pfeifferi]|uniref:Ferric-chelate reductase 1 n=1 Tax=Biomphalaria pfeifferi TaxID=112525 RepID=A0AAD8BS79_BIOPF|nr:ferric-chelate reductase 1 [Biomphalaria pfeifferi]